MEIQRKTQRSSTVRKLCRTASVAQTVLMEGYLESSIINSPLLWLSAAPLTHSSTEADSTSAWLSRGTPRFRHYVRSPLCACVRVCLSVRLLKQNANTAERCSAWCRLKKRKKKNPRRVGGRELCESVCCSVKEGRERNGLRNSEVVQENWAEPQCCVAEAERVLFA